MTQASLLKPTRKTDAKYLRDQVLLAEQHKNSAAGSADTATTQAGIATTQAGVSTTGANNAATQAGLAAASAATAKEISNISEVQAFTNPLLRAVRVAMTYSNSSRGLLAAHSKEFSFAEGQAYTLHFEGALADYSNGLIQVLLRHSAGSPDWAGYLLQVSEAGKLRVPIFNGVDSATTYLSTEALQKSDGEFSKLTAVVNPPSALSDGSITFYCDGSQLGDSVTIPAGTPAVAEVSAPMTLFGTETIREAGIFGRAIIYNRGLSSTEVLDLAINGPSPADIGAPGNRAGQSDILEGYDFTDGWATQSFGAIVDSDTFQVTGSGGGISKNYPALQPGDKIRVVYAGSKVGTGELTINIGGYPSGIAATITADGAFAGESEIVVGTSSGGQVYLRHVGAATTDITFTQLKVYRIGITGLWSAEHAQSDTGQVLDQIHGNHALLPSSGATRIPQNLRPVIESPSAHSWTLTNEIQYVAANQALMSADDSFLVIDIDSDTAFSIDLGDGADQDRFVAAYALSVGKNRLTITNPFNDGTNRKLTVKPTASVTAEISVHAEMIKERI